jgi:hypothetical protein
VSDPVPTRCPLLVLRVTWDDDLDDYRRTIERDRYQEALRLLVAACPHPTNADMEAAEAALGAVLDPVEASPDLVSVDNRQSDIGAPVASPPATTPTPDDTPICPKCNRAVGGKVGPYCTPITCDAWVITQRFDHDTGEWVNVGERDARSLDIVTGASPPAEPPPTTPPIEDDAHDPEAWGRAPATEPEATP